MARIFLILLACICVATVLAQAISFGYLWYTQKVDEDKLFKILAVVHDVDFDRAAESTERIDTSQELQGEPSFEEIEEWRAVKSRDLELKTQALEKGLAELRFEQTQLTEDKQRHADLKQSFEQKMATLSDETKASGYAAATQTLEIMKPRQAKDHILKMIDNDELSHVVVILSNMPIDKRRKIIQQFTSPQEIDVLDSILRLIRQGGAEARLIDETREQAQAN